MTLRHRIVLTVIGVSACSAVGLLSCAPKSSAVSTSISYSRMKGFLSINGKSVRDFRVFQSLECNLLLQVGTGTEQSLYLIYPGLERVLLVNQGCFQVTPERAVLETRLRADVLGVAPLDDDPHVTVRPTEIEFNLVSRGGDRATLSFDRNEYWGGS